MATRRAKTLPTIAPCPCGMRPRTNHWPREWNVVCYSCDRRGEAKKTERASIESWNADWNRRSDAEAELAKLRLWKAEQQQALIHLACVAMECGLVKTRSDDCIEVAVKAMRDLKTGDAEAERRGAMAAVKWLEDIGYGRAPFELRQAIERGEVPPEKGKRR